VVYRNELIELIPVLAQSEQIYAVPLLFWSPWINKYLHHGLAAGQEPDRMVPCNTATLFRHQLQEPRFEHA